MNLGFKDQFVPFVEDGSKTHSIRAGERWKVGMRADCYARPRQKGMRLLFRAPVVRVEELRVRVIDERLAIGVPLHKAVIMTVDGIGLDDDELDAFAWRDGFRVGQSGYGAQMMAFWAKAHDLRHRDFHGQIVHWDYAARFDVGGLVSVEQAADAIRIYGYEPNLAALASLSSAERKRVETYCFKSHLRASDNRCKVPPMPKGFRDLLGGAR